MAHFAELDGNVVTNVIVVNNDILDSSNEEASGLDFLQGLFGHRNFKQTSYNCKIRKQYAAIGYTYDEEKDAFITPQPFASWTLDNHGDWQAPKVVPDQTKNYYWDEDLGDWVETETV